VYIPNCQYCGARAKLANAYEVFGKDSDQHYYICFNFPSCDALVGCHPGTINPYGILANRELRHLRRLVHNAIDPFWQSGRMTRDQVYEQIERELNLTPDEAHIGMLNKAQCETILCRYQFWQAPVKMRADFSQFSSDKIKRMARRKRRKARSA